ncbi:MULTISPECIES: hypothetical protein [Flavobacteriaceae]|jgi:C4-dicarboxylate transporter|uniref:Uncharacterized protein n=1 Tax=Croceibacter atlanticus (strain ATCC BAA-628 / JCM 21780 / CIP 108009 / IAM 15332 / KCTC 12090 / HTCC2559) TaxID=216432 RepID=A3U4J6_CROAH|nr:hypothetical protein [Croceibacter atlanticus]EAP87163.1 hypothetical protein CA2559_00370 [Croceibacter atlanticus HTCC2559]
MDINPSEIMISAIVGVVVAELWNFIKRKYEETRPIKKLKKIKAIKVLWFILSYILPLGTIVFLIIDKNTEPTFKNISLFIIICISLVYNLLMSHIINLYKMNTKLTNISSEKLTKIDQTFDKVYHHIEKTKSDNNLK